MKKIFLCPICKSKSFTFQYNSKDRMFGISGSFTVKRCDNCSCVFLDPQPDQKELKKYYPSRRYYSYSKKENVKSFFKTLREYLVKHYYSPNLLSMFISTFIQNVPAMPAYGKKGKILDLGCGAGDMLILLKQLGWETYGIDIDERAIRNAQMIGLKNVALGTYKDLVRYKNNYFDVIRLYHVIEHIDDPSFCLRLIRKKLKNTGEIVIGTPNIDSVVSKIFKSYWYNLDTPRHVTLFSPATLKGLIREEGFIIKKIEFCATGGIVGSLQYFFGDMMGNKIDLIHKVYFVLLFYPLEWILNRLGEGDVFVLRARKE